MRRVPAHRLLSLPAWSHVVSVWGGAALLVFVLTGTAYAEDPKPEGAKARKDYVVQLTDAERGFLEKRIKSWAELSSAKQQRIARNVVRMRTMTEDEKKRLLEHIKRLPRRGGHSHHGKHRGGYHDRATQALIRRGLARFARKKLGRDFARQLREKDISDHGFEQAFAMTFWRTVSEQGATGAAPLAPPKLPADFPKDWRADYARLHSQWAAMPADDRKRAGMARRLRFRLIRYQGERFRIQLAKTDLKGDAYVAAVGTAVHKQWPEAFAQSLSEPETLLRNAEKYEMRRSIKRLLARTGRLGREEAGLLAALLNRLAAYPRKGESVSPAVADAALKQVLIRELKVPASALEGLPPATDVAAREAFLGKLLSRHRGRGSYGRRGAEGTARGQGRRAGAWGVPKLERPEGLTDADWSAWLTYRQAVQAALKAKDTAALRRLREAKPTAMSAEGYALVRKALKAQYAAGGERRSKGGRKPRR